FAHRTEERVFGPSWQELFGGRREIGGASAPWWARRREALLAIGRASTPTYVYDAEEVAAAADRLRSLASVDRIFYATQANARHPAHLRALAAAGVGCEPATPGEIARAPEVLPRLPASEILFTPNFAPRADYELGCEQGVRVTVDNVHPVEAWPEVFRGRDVLLRLDPGRGRGRHATGRSAGSRSACGVACE